MNVLIIEDEELAAERLVNQLKQYDPAIQVLTILSTVKASTHWLSNNPQPDLILLDIQLADGLCFEIFKQVKIKSPIIFCTAFNQYALEAFQVHSIDYLLKPVSYQKLENSLRKMEEMLGKSSSFKQETQLSELINAIKLDNQSFKTRFMVKIGPKIKAIKTTDIAYFYSSNKLTLLVTKEAQSFPVDYALEELMTQLDPQLFFHVNRNLLIHIDAAKEIHPYFKGRLKLVLNPPIEDGGDVVISSQKTPLFKMWLGQ